MDYEQSPKANIYESDEIDSDLEFELYSQVHYSDSVPQLNNDHGKSEPCTTTDVEHLHSTNNPSGEKEIHNCNNDHESCEQLSTTNAKSSLSANNVQSKAKEKISENGKESSSSNPFAEASEEEEIIEEIMVVDTWSEYDSDSSEASKIESWQILDGNTVDCGECSNDLSIHVSDNLTCSDSVDSDWFVNVEDMQLAKGKGMGKSAPRYFETDKRRCKNCDKVGHIAVDCTKPKKQKPCFKCAELGHHAMECPNMYHLKQRKSRIECHRCGHNGHEKYECPDVWRQYHLTTKPGNLVCSSLPMEETRNKNCFNCGGTGHFGHECRHMGMRKAVYAIASPLVTMYDTWIRIKRMISSKKSQQKEVRKGRVEKRSAVSTNAIANYVSEKIAVHRNKKKRKWEKSEEFSLLMDEQDNEKHSNRSSGFDRFVAQAQFVANKLVPKRSKKKKFKDKVAEQVQASHSSFEHLVSERASKHKRKRKRHRSFITVE